MLGGQRGQKLEVVIHSTLVEHLQSAITVVGTVDTAVPRMNKNRCLHRLDVAFNRTGGIQTAVSR